MRLAGLFLFLLAFTSPAFAQKACTEIGCQSGLVFNVDPRFDWKSGQYRIDVAIDYKTVSCYGVLPLRSCENGPTFRCDDPAVIVQESGCALPRNAHAISGVQVFATPKKAIVRIARNNKTIVTRTVVPQYNSSMPNGAGCGPVCRSASYDLLAAE